MLLAHPAWLGDFEMQPIKSNFESLYFNTGVLCCSYSEKRDVDSKEVANFSSSMSYFNDHD